MRSCVCWLFLMTLAVSSAWAEGAELPPGPAKKKIETSCTLCHDLKMITKQHQDKKWWAETLEKMQGLGAEIAPEDHGLYLKYLSANFGVGGAGKKKAAKD